MTNKKIKVIQKENEDEIPVEIIASSILKISNAWKQVRKSQLNQKCIVILLAHATKLPQYEVEKVLDGLDELEKMYLKK